MQYLSLTTRLQYYPYSASYKISFNAFMNPFYILYNNDDGTYKMCSDKKSKNKIIYIKINPELLYKIFKIHFCD